MRLNMSILYDELREWVIESRIKDDLALGLELVRKLPLDKNAKLSEQYLYCWTDENFPIEFPRYGIYAGERKFSEMKVPESVEIIRLEVDTSENLQIHLLHIFEKYAHWYEKLVNAVLKNQSLKKILDIGCSELKNPVALCNSAGICLACSGTFPDGYHDLIWDKLFATNSTYSDKIQQMLQQDGTMTPPNIAIKLLGKTKDMPLDVYSVNITPYNKHMERIAFLGSTSVWGEITSGELSIQQELSRILGFVPELIRDVQRGYQGINQLISDLLDGKESVVISSQDLLNRFFPQNGSKFYLTCIEIYETSMIEELLDKLKRSLKPTELVLRYKDRLVLVLPDEFPKIEIRERVEEIGGIFGSTSIKSGVSLPFDDVFQIRAYYQQALDAISIGMSKNEEDTVYFFQNYAMTYFITVLGQKLPLEQYCHPTVRFLGAWDKEHATDFLCVLKQLYRHNGNKLKAAEALFIHRNTLSYKLERLKELLNVDEIDYSDAQYFLLSCDYMLPVIGGRCTWWDD